MEFLEPNILEEVESPVNGKISVVRSLGLGTYIQVENLTQSGGLVNEIWRNALREIKLRKREVKNCLILGLGGGSAASKIKDLWPEAEIIGVDIDPVMVDLGRKYLGLNGVNAVIDNAWDFVIKARQASLKYDLILIDIYLGRSYPKEFERADFLIRIQGLLVERGLAVFNRLYYEEKRPQATKFGDKLEKVFAKVERFYPQANLMLIASDTI